VRLAAKVLFGLAFWTVGLAFVLVGLLLRGGWEALRLGWLVPEHVARKQREDAVDELARKLGEL